MDLDRDGIAADVKRLVEAGVDLITTNTPREMGQLLSTQTEPRP
jgi:glycerophosphoryl diester phosphodiesterase